MSIEDLYEHEREARSMAVLAGTEQVVPNTCPVTLIKGCKARHCELHYMDAEVRLAPPGFTPESARTALNQCPACLGPADHKPFDLGSGCLDVLSGLRDLS